MPGADLKELVGLSSFSFVGTVEQAGASASASLAADDRTAIVRVDEVLHAPEAFARTAGTRVTLRLAPGEPALAKGDRAAFFANGLAYGETIALEEVGRHPVPAFGAMGAGGISSGVSDAALELADAEVDARVVAAAAVVAGRVVALAKAEPGKHGGEHDADWWKATISVDVIVRGAVAGDTVDVLYANSKDVRWHQAPKPRASQQGVWLLQAARPELKKLAPYMIIDPLDYQPPEQLARIQGPGG